MHKVKISEKNKEKIINTAVVILLSLMIISVVFYVWHDIQTVKKHKEECIKLCHPDEIIDSLSSDHCICKILKTKYPKDMI